MLRKFFYFTAIFFIASGAFGKSQLDLIFPLKGESMADRELQLEALRTVYAISSDYNKKCRTYSIVDTKVVQKSSSGKSWQELWTVERCGTRVEVPVSFILDEAGFIKHRVHLDDLKR